MTQHDPEAIAGWSGRQSNFCVHRILKKRASDLDARRQEAQRLLQFAAKLDREELKVAALESKAMKVCLLKPCVQLHENAR